MSSDSSSEFSDFPIPPSVQTRTIPAAVGSRMGNGLLAAEDIQTGEDVVYSKTPLVAVLDTPTLENICSGCFGRKQVVNVLDEFGNASKLKACNGCHVTRYCDRDCQRKDWKSGHSMECPIFKKLLPRILPNSARALLRMCLRSHRGDYSEEDQALLQHQEIHQKELFERDSEWKRLTLLSMAMKEYSQTDMDEEAMFIYAAILDLNTFIFFTCLQDRIGVYYHPYAALINHSCDYNSVVGFDGEELFIKAIRPIRKDEQIFISYIDTSEPFDARQSQLKERYYFKCRCSKCKQEARTINSSRSTGLPARTEAGQDAYNLMKNAETAPHPFQSIKILAHAMQRLSQAGMPITGQPYASIRADYIQFSTSLTQWRRAFLHSAICCLRIDPVTTPNEAHPMREVHLYYLARLAVLLSQERPMDRNLTDTDDPLKPTDTDALEEYNLDYGLILWSILHGLVSQQARSCNVPSFKEMIKAKYLEVDTEYQSKGVNPGSMQSMVDAQWAKVESAISKEFERENQGRLV